MLESEEKGHITSFSSNQSPYAVIRCHLQITRYVFQILPSLATTVRHILDQATPCRCLDELPTKNKNAHSCNMIIRESPLKRI
jgi:hypothetical protein